jgi:hypothetical protein
MKYSLLTFFLLTLHTALWAQAPRNGKVILNNSEVISGTVDINSFINSAVVTSEDGRQLTYHASMISSIETIDECDFRREYRCFDYRSNSFFDRLEKKVFQVIVEGEVTLLRRVFEYDVFDASDDYKIEEFYYIDESNNIRRIRNFKRQIMPMMENFAEEMEVFRQRNRMGNLNRELNMYLMVSYYNRISSLEEDALTLR